MFSFYLSSFLLLFSLSFSSCLFSPPFDDRSLEGPKPPDARPVDAKRGRSGRGSLAERKPLTGRDGETKKPKEKRKKKSSKGCAEPAFPKPANFLGEITFFFKNGCFVQALGGGAPRGSAAAAGFSEGSKTLKNGKKSSFSACPIGNFQSKRCFSI